MILAALTSVVALIAAQVALSANDGKQVLVDGVQTVPERPAPDSVSILSLDGATPRELARLAVPTSVIGPPSSVAIAPDGSFALVTAARRIASDRGSLVPDDRVTMIGLGASPRVIASARAGAGASGVAISPSGKLALVADRAGGTVSVFAISGGQLDKRATIDLGNAAASPAQPLFYAGGTRALVTRDGDHKISILAIEGSNVRLLPETLAPGLRPYEITTGGDETYAVVAMIGGGGRDTDTIGLIDLSLPSPRVIDIVAVGLTPEGVRMAPDGRHVAVNVNEGSNAAPKAPQYRAMGRLQIWKIADRKLHRVTEAPIGGWGQGVAWSRNGRRVYAQAVVEQRLDSFAFDGRRLTRGASLAMPAGPAAIAVSAR